MLDGELGSQHIVNYFFREASPPFFIRLGLTLDLAKPPFFSLCGFIGLVGTPPT